MDFSVVSPFHNEEGNVNEFYRRLKIVMDKLSKNWEFIAVDDGSRDNTLELLDALSKKDKHIRVVVLSRNFGHEAAVTAGLDHSNADVTILMDGDLQDAPEFIPEMVSKINDGYDVVYANHPTRNDGLAKNLLFKCFYLLFGKLSSFNVPLNAGAFSVMRRPALEALKSFGEQSRYVAGLRAWIGFRQTGVLYEKKARFSGKSAQGFRGLFKMGLDAVFSFSYIPLRLATFLGLFVTTGAAIVSLNVIYQKYFTHTAIIGWTGQMLSILIIGGVQLIILGIVGEYLGRIYDEVRKRPYYIIKDKINF